MKRLVILLMLMASTSFAAPPARVYNYAAGAIIQPAENTANEDALFGYLTRGVDTYAALSIDTASLAAGSVTSAKILDGTIVNADVSATAAIDYTKLTTIPYSHLTLTGLITGADLDPTIAITTSGAFNTTGVFGSTNTVTTTNTTTTSGLYVTGRVQDKDGDYGTTGQVLMASGEKLNWTTPVGTSLAGNDTTTGVEINIGAGSMATFGTVTINTVAGQKVFLNGYVMGLPSGIARNYTIELYRDATSLLASAVHHVPNTYMLAMHYGIPIFFVDTGAGTGSTTYYLKATNGNTGGETDTFGWLSVLQVP